MMLSGRPRRPDGTRDRPILDRRRPKLNLAFWSVPMNSGFHRSAGPALAVIAVLCLPAAVSNRSLDDWPQWRGAKRGGVSVEKGLLNDWPQARPPPAWARPG